MKKKDLDLLDFLGMLLSWFIALVGICVASVYVKIDPHDLGVVVGLAIKSAAYAPFQFMLGFVRGLAL